MRIAQIIRDRYSFKETLLATEIWLNSVSRFWLAPLILVILWTTLHFGVLHTLQKKVSAERSELDMEYGMLRAASKQGNAEPADDIGWHALRHVMVPITQQDRVFASLFKSAESHQVRVVEASYSTVKTPLDGVIQTVVRIPIKGSYPDIRAWFDDILLANPALSMDDITFKRETVGNTQIEAQLRFTLTTEAGVDRTQRKSAAHS